MIVFTRESVKSQVAELARHYKSLSVIEVDAGADDEVRLSGKMRVFRSALGFTLNRVYEIEVRIPVGSDRLPVVVDLGEVIDVEYPHRYKTGELCLETDAAVRFRFIDGFRLVDWMKEYVEPFFFSYEYYVRFGVLPFGERPHGVEGVLDGYRELFGELDFNVTWRLVRFCGKGKYRGHIDCPCGNGKKIRDCRHGGVLLQLMSDRRKKEIVKIDLKYLDEEVKKYELAKKNYKATE